MNRGFGGGGILAIIPKAQSTEVGNMLDFIKFKNFHSAEKVELTLSTTPKKSGFSKKICFLGHFSSADSVSGFRPGLGLGLRG